MIYNVNQFQVKIAQPPIRDAAAILFYFIAPICY